MDIINRISALLEEQNKSQKDLTDYLGVEKSVFSTWKKNKSKSYMKYINQIAEFFNVSVDYLLGRNEMQIYSNDFSGSSNVSFGENTIINNPAQKEEMSDELVDLVKSLPLVKRAKAIIYLNNLKNSDNDE